MRWQRFAYGTTPIVADAFDKSDALLTFGRRITFDAYHGVFEYNQGSYFSMAEGTLDREFLDSDQSSEVSSTTTPEAYFAQDSFEDKAPIPRAPNTAVLVLSWGVFSVGLYFFYAAGMGYY